MGILGIENRTENWKTAQSFSPFFNDAEARYRLAQRLLKPLNKDLECKPEEIKLELFWNGVRDHLAVLKGKRDTPERRSQFAGIYQRLFPDLRIDLKKFGVKLSKKVNYNVSEKSGIGMLYHHLHGGEADVVLEAPGYLFIGEAKFEGEFNDYGKRVLVHQLVRQYVVATIFLEIMAQAYERQAANQIVVIPFVAGDNDSVESLKKKEQVNFMVKQGWLNPGNFLSWMTLKG